MNTHHSDQLQAQINRFDAIQQESTEATFAGKVVDEYMGLGITQSFEATFVDAPRIEAIADIHPNGAVASVDIYVSEGGEGTAVRIGDI